MLQRTIRTILGLCCVLIGGIGCTTTPSTAPTDHGTVEPRRPVQLRDLAKTDVDMVAEIHLHTALEHLRDLMIKLYRRNPRQWKTTGKKSAQAVVAEVFDGNYEWDFPELDGKRGAASIHLAFRDDYAGDRVLAFGVGLTSMVLAAYNNKTEFFLTDELEPQKLYNSARNIEIAAWKLEHDRNARGELFLLSNSRAGEIRNLSFERLLGKLMAGQDAIARIVSGKTQRTIKNIIQRMAGAVFLPI